MEFDDDSGYLDDVDVEYYHDGDDDDSHDVDEDSHDVDAEYDDFGII